MSVSYSNLSSGSPSLQRQKPELLSLSVCMHAKSLQQYLTLCNPMDCNPPGSSVHGDSPGKNAEVGSRALLQATFPTQGSNPRPLWVLHCRQILRCWATRTAPLSPVVMINFTCQLNQAAGCPGIWSKYYSGCVCECVSGWDQHWNL